MFYELCNFQYSEIDSLYLSELYFLLINNHVERENEGQSTDDTLRNIKSVATQSVRAAI